MKKNLILLLIITTAQLLVAQQNLPFKLEKDWEVSGLKGPESVVLDMKNNVLYVSNVNGTPTEKNGKGFISKVSLSGEMIEQEWLTNLNAPKGLTIYGDKLYTTDIDEIVEIDIATKKFVKFKADKATFLNDIVADKKGNIYASNTFGFSAIYKFSKKDRTVTQWLKNEKLNMPNGLFIKKNKLYVAGWGIDLNPKTFETKMLGKLLIVDLKTKAIEKITNPIGNLDGLEATLHGFLISDWLAGKLLYYSNKSKKVTKALDLSKGSADIHFNKKNKTLFIPLMLDGKLLKYHFKK